MKSRTIVTVVALFLVVASSAALAGQEDVDASENVELTIRLGSADTASKSPVRTYQLVLDGAGERTEMMVGARVAIPTTKFDASKGGTINPVTSFTYQNVGINIDIEPRVHHNKEITLTLRVEVSSLSGTVSATAATNSVTASKRR